MADRTSVSWRGYWTATTTPFTQDGGLDLPAWEQLLEHHLRSGVHGILVNGTSGEWFSQSAAERTELAKVAVQVVGGRVPVLAGVSAYTAAESADLAVAAAAAGVDGILATPPPYVHPSDDELFTYFQDVAASTDLPFMLYNWPRGTAVDMSLELLQRLADLDQVVAIKDSTGDVAKSLRALELLSPQLRFFSRLINPHGLAVMRGLGGDGFLDGGALGAAFGVPFFEALWSEDLDAARVAAERFNALSSGLLDQYYAARFASPTAQIKAAMRLLGQPGGWVRRPLLDLHDDDKLQALRQHLVDCGLSAATSASQ